MKVIVYERADGGVSVFWPNPVARATDVRRDGVYDTDRGTGRQERPHKVYPRGRLRRPETEEEFLTRLAFGGAKIGALLPQDGAVPPEVDNVQFVEAADLPPDRAQRNAWRLREGKIVCQAEPEKGETE